jgi:hypothetical protein
MNRYLFLHRIKGPIMILVFGVTALLDQWHILSYGESWPLYLIVYGLLQLAERAAWSQAQVAPGPYAGGPSAGYPGYTGYPTPPAVPGGYTGQRGGWAGPSGPQPPSTGLSVRPPDMPRGTEREDEGRR